MYINNEQPGWIKLHRRSLSSSVWKRDAKTWKVWSWCLLKATHSGYKFPFNGHDIELSKGQFISGRKVAIEEIGITDQEYRTVIKYLKSTGRIAIKATNKFSIITVLKWEEHQSDGIKLTSKLDNHHPGTNQQLTTYNKDKNNKNDNIINYTDLKKPFNDFMRVKCKDGSIALRRFNKWVDDKDDSVMINLSYYTELQ